MDLEKISIVAPILSVVALFLFEKLALHNNARFQRVVPLVMTQGLNLAVAFGLSVYLLIPVVRFFAPFQIFSFSELQAPVLVSFVGSILFLDFISYLNHRLHHAVPVLWRIHRLHHSDREMDVFTTFLHHPLEVVSGFLMVIAAAVLFDVPTVALMAYTTAVGVHAAFTHMRCRIPHKFDRVIKWFFVTPNFHQIHHSLDMREGNSNFGTIFVFWDYLMRTICAPSKNSRGVRFGIDKGQSPNSGSVGSLMMNPFK